MFGFRETLKQAPVVIERPRIWPAMLVGMVMCGGAVGGSAYYLSQRSDAPESVVEVRGTTTIRTAVRDIARLEVTEVSVEKVIDLVDRQQRVFGMLDTEDAMLLVASGSAVITVDLEQLDDSDIRFDERTRTLHLRLPEPKVSHARLDPDKTYVYRRDTGVLARRNEQLEGRARKEATQAIEDAANTPELLNRAKKQAERQLTSLLSRSGARQVLIEWHRGERS